MRTAIIACLATMAVIGLANGVTVVPSTFIPAPGAEITLQAVGAPAGATFRWDLGADGRPDVTTDQPWVRWTVPAGYWEVGLEVVQGGRIVDQAKIAVVADARLGAVRTVQWVNGALEITVTVLAKVRVLGPGVVEDIPPGWVATASGPESALAKVNEKNQIEILVPSLELQPGEEATIRYLLYPPSPDARARFTGWVTGYWSGDGRVERVEVPVAGTVTF